MATSRLASAASDEKAHVTMTDYIREELNPGGVAPIVSAFAGHSRRSVTRKFWRLYAIGVLVAFGGVYVSTPSSPFLPLLALLRVDGRLTP